MSYPVIENPVTGERGIVRRAPASDGSPLVADLYARPGAAVVGDHLHPHASETFTVVRGTLGLSRGQAMQRPAGEYWDHREARMTRRPVTRTEPGT